MDTRELARAISHCYRTNHHLRAVTLMAGIVGLAAIALLAPPWLLIVGLGAVGFGLLLLTCYGLTAL